MECLSNADEVLFEKTGAGSNTAFGLYIDAYSMAYHT